MEMDTDEKILVAFLTWLVARVLAWTLGYVAINITGHKSRLSHIGTANLIADFIVLWIFVVVGLAFAMSNRVSDAKDTLDVLGIYVSGAFTVYFAYGCVQYTRELKRAADYVVARKTQIYDPGYDRDSSGRDSSGRDSSGSSSSRDSYVYVSDIEAGTCDSR